MTWSPTNELCSDWIFSTGSNVHACKDRGWFTDYTTFESYVYIMNHDDSAFHIIENDRMPIAGVGTVLLHVEKSPDPRLSAAESNGQLILHNVVHCPKLACNVIGYTESFPRNNSVCLLRCHLGLSKGTVTDPMGQPVAYFMPKKHLHLLKLSDPPFGPVVAPSIVQNDGQYLTNLRWSESEKSRWKRYLESLIASLSAMELKM